VFNLFCYQFVLKFILFGVINYGKERDTQLVSLVSIRAVSWQLVSGLDVLLVSVVFIRVLYCNAMLPTMNLCIACFLAYTVTPISCPSILPHSTYQ
jgi:hypothetical protein